MFTEPVPHADFVTTTTTRRCAVRAAAWCCAESYAKDLDRTVFPGVQGGPLMHIIAAKAVFQEAASPEFAAYQKQIVKTRRGSRAR